jgi:hypothetical protein
MEIKPGFCACGSPLHYINKDVEKLVEHLVQQRGEMVKIAAPSGTFLVQRHQVF